VNVETKPAADGDAIVEFRSVHYTLPRGQVLLRDVSFTVRRGETLVLLGRSGAGKTTALKLINRLADPTAGAVNVDGRSTVDWDPIALRRHIGYVIQETGLFPHYTVEQNISLIPRLERWPTPQVRERAQELLAAAAPKPHRVVPASACQHFAFWTPRQRFDRNDVPTCRTIFEFR